jgi:hypothetical protein
MYIGKKGWELDIHYPGSFLTVLWIRQKNFCDRNFSKLHATLTMFKWKYNYNHVLKSFKNCNFQSMLLLILLNEITS